MYDSSQNCVIHGLNLSEKTADSYKKIISTPLNKEEIINVREMRAEIEKHIKSTNNKPLLDLYNKMIDNYPLNDDNLNNKRFPKL